jgi:hypothetical protein
MGAGIALSIWWLGHWLDNWEITVWFLAGTKRCLSTSKHLYWLWTPFSLLFNGYRDLSLRVKQWRQEADHSSAYSAKDANECSYTSTLTYAFMAYVGIFTCIWYIIFLSICFPRKKITLTNLRFSQQCGWQWNFLMGYPRHPQPYHCKTLKTHMVQLYEEVPLWHVGRCEKLEVFLLKTLCSWRWKH